MSFSQDGMVALRLPPLNAVRAFEAAARHSSFTRAADELCVTPGAISRQVRSLEDYFQKPLFDRGYREVTLTEASRLYSRSLSDAFSQVHAATRDFVSADEMRSLTIYAPITFTLHWLTKRLASFHALHPQLGIRITSEGFAPTSFAASEFDVVLRLAGASSGLEAIHLFDLELVPVCSPLYLEQSGVKHPSDLLAHPLLLSERRSADWQNWLKTARVPAQGPLNTLSFHSSALAYQAAADGCGFAIAMKQLVTDELANGTLVTPFDLAAIDGTAFHAVFPTGMDNDPVVRSFLDWIIRETGSSDR